MANISEKYFQFDKYFFLNTSVKLNAMRIRKPRNISTAQLMVVTVVGVLGGIYIWRPLLTKFRSEEITIEKSHNPQTPAQK